MSIALNPIDPRSAKISQALLLPECSWNNPCWGALSGYPSEVFHILVL